MNDKILRCTSWVLIILSSVLGMLIAGYTRYLELDIFTAIVLGIGGGYFSVFAPFILYAYLLGDGK